MTTPRKNWFEWTVFSAGLLLLLLTTGYLGYQALTSGQRPAVLTVTLGEPWVPDASEPGQVIVPVTVHNDGGRTAAEVQVEISLVHDAMTETGETNEVEATANGSIERRELTFAFVPHMSSRAGALPFVYRPGRAALRARVLGYLEP